MSGDRRHLYQITLEAGQCLKIIAEQRGADISLTLNGPPNSTSNNPSDSPSNSHDGEQLATAENNRGDKGVEWLLWQAQAPGNYLLEVNSRENSGGSYRLSV